MTQNDIRRAVMAVNSNLATNNPRGVTDALKGIGYPVDSRFDILSNSELNKALLGLYDENPSTWASVVRSVPFNYQKTDSSTSPATIAEFQNITRAFNPNDPSVLRDEVGRKWWEVGLDYIIGSTTTITSGLGTLGTTAKTPTWVYVGLTLTGLSIVALVIFTIIQLKKK